MQHIKLTQVGRNGNSHEIDLDVESVRLIEPIMRDVGGLDVPERRSVGAKSRVYTDLAGRPVVEVLEGRETIIARLADAGTIFGESRKMPFVPLPTVYPGELDRDKYARQFKAQQDMISSAFKKDDPSIGEGVCGRL